MKKFVHICLMILAISVTLTACEKTEENHVTGVPSETTSLTLTEEFTVTTLPPEPPVALELALYSPFADVAKADNSVQKQIEKDAEKIVDARAFLYAAPTMFYEKSNYNFMNYADVENPLEENELEEYSYLPLNPEIAETEEELVRYMRSCFTENFISDEELRKTLFEAERGETIPAEYKTIDGVLCIKRQYLGVYADIHFDTVNVVEYSGETAKITACGCCDYPPHMFFMDIAYSEEYGWRLDGIESKEYFPDEAALLYNAVTLRADVLNMILGGGNVPENARTTVIDGETYTQTDLDLTVAEMEEFLRRMFRSDYFVKKYVYGAYAEVDGVLYRRDGAPRRYLPEMKIDPCGDLPMIDSSPIKDFEMEFYDGVRDESFTQTVSIEHDLKYIGHDDVTCRNEYEYTYLYIASGLPIREYPND